MAWITIKNNVIPWVLCLPWLILFTLFGCHPKLSQNNNSNSSLDQDKKEELVQNDEARDSTILQTKKKLPFTPYHNQRTGLEKSFYKFEHKKKGRVAFLGGSITYNPGWRDSVMYYLEGRFPDTEFDFIAAGVPSMGSTPGAFRLERDVLAHGPVDLLFEEAVVNDATNGRSTTEQIRAMEGIVRHVRSANMATDIVFMYFVDPDKMEDYRDGRIPQVIQNHEKVADHYNIPSINLAKEVTDRIDAGEFTWEDDFVNLHPSPFGQEIYARSIIQFLGKAWEEVDQRKQPAIAYPLPDKLDKYSYDGGQLIEVDSDMETDGWNYHQNWAPTDGTGTRANYTNVPMLIGTKAGALLEFKFSGRAIGIAVAAGHDAGIIEYRIDKGAWHEQNLFTKWSSGLHLPWYYTLDSELEEGNHQVELRLMDKQDPDSNGKVCRIRYFYVNR